MANNLSAILPTIYLAADQIARELVGFTPAVFRNSSAERAAVGQSITYDVVGAMTEGDVTPAAVLADAPDQTISSGTMTISKAKSIKFRWTGEEQKGMSNGDIALGSDVLLNQFKQAMRRLVNLVEIDLFTAAYQGASRAVGTAGTSPFGTANDLSDFANVLRVLEDNGVPSDDLHLVVGGAGMVNLRGKQSVLFKVNEAGTDQLLRKGRVGEVMNMNIHNSNAVQALTKGTGAGYVTNGSTAVGVSDIALITGTGTVLSGDVVTFAADAVNKYVVGTGVAAPGTISLNKPGAKVVIPTSNALTVGNSYTPNIAFDRNAIHLITRAPAMPVEGDLALDVTEVQDPISGLAFQIALYPGIRQVIYEVSLAWGVKAVKPDFIATLMG